MSGIQLTGGRRTGFGPGPAREPSTRRTRARQEQLHIEVISSNAVRYQIEFNGNGEFNENPDRFAWQSVGRTFTGNLVSDPDPGEVNTDQARGPAPITVTVLSGGPLTVENLGTGERVTIREGESVTLGGDQQPPADGQPSPGGDLPLGIIAVVLLVGAVAVASR